MNPTATVRLRRATAAIALVWALVAFGMSVKLRVDSESRYGPPFLFEGLATDPWRISGVTPEAAQAGLQDGDQLIAIDGRPVGSAILHWRDLFRAGTTNVYRVEKSDGAVMQYVLAPRLPADLLTPLMWVVAIGLPIVGLVYLGVGLWVWRLRPNRASTWSLFLFCCVMAAELSLPPVPGRWAWAMVWINVPLIGASTFHLFTTYPTEPAWIVRNPTLRWLPYAIAFPLGIAAAFEGAVGLKAPVAKTTAFWFTIVLAFVSLGIAMHNRRAARESKTAGRADVMLLGAVVSFVPALLAVISRTVLDTGFPWVLGFFSFFIFPLTVAYGIVRRQLFDIRLVAKSSATYGAVTLGITGLFALIITFADAVGVALQHGRALAVVLGGVPVLRHRRSSIRCACACRRWWIASSTATARLPPRRARDLRGDGLDALRARDRGPHPGRGERDDGRRALDGDAAGRGRAAARGRGVARRVGQTTRWASRSPLDHPIAASCCAPRRARARGLRRRARSRSRARPAATSSTSSKSSCWCRSCSAWSCSA